MLNLNPFDPKAALLAKHAQHVVLVHFPIALYLTGTLFDFLASRINKSGLREAARLNFLIAALATLPTALTGWLAWWWALEAQPIKGVLRLHLVLANAVIVAMWLTVFLRARRNSTGDTGEGKWLLLVEAAVCVLVAATAHLGGFLSGVNAG